MGQASRNNIGAGRATHRVPHQEDKGGRIISFNTVNHRGRALHQRLERILKLLGTKTRGTPVPKRINADDLELAGPTLTDIA